MQAEVAVGVSDASTAGHVSNPDGAAPVAQTVWRVRTLAVCVALTALAFLQDPGLIVVDTKVDLTINPVRWLERALHVWNPSGAFGQLQNQSYGYLWPMGPFFVAGDWVGLPDWVVQRLWWALLLCVAFTGVARLADRMAIGTQTTRLVAGVVFALSPRILTELGTISVEAWPMAVAPWVLVPLIGLTHGTPVRHAVTRSALAMACAGGVNATAVVAVAPLALLWLITLRPLRLRITAIAAWCLAVAAATAWWVLPLLVLGRYSPPFLNYIETAAVTTQVTDLVTVMRGASHWQAYFGGAHGPIWPAGWRLATEPFLIVATLALASLGLAGLARRGMPHRRFLVTGLLVGIALVGLGHVATLDGAFADQQRSFLDGVGAPLRNVHKFDLVLRLPLVLGLAHLLCVFGRAASAAPHRLHPARVRAAAVTAATLAAIGGAATPALAGGVPAHGSFKEVPRYWYEASDWLDRHLDNDRVLVLPSARFPSYLWGSPAEEITQPLLAGGWVARNSIPLTPAATIRLLDAVEGALVGGDGSAGLAGLLARSGVRYVLVRSDLNYGRSDTTRPAIVRQALARSPGLFRVAEFGPRVGGTQLPGNYADYGLDVQVRALEVFEVGRRVDPVVVYDASDVTTVVGGPESLVDLAAAGQLSSAPTILAGDSPTGRPTGPVAITDGLRRRELAFGLLHDNASATMTAEEAFKLPTPAHDYLPPWADGQAAVVTYHGISNVTASSSWAQAQPLGGGRPAHHPFAAVDGDPTTSWRSAPGTLASTQWLEVLLDSPQAISEVRLNADLGADTVPTRVTVSTGTEDATVDVTDGTATAHFDAARLTRRVRVSIDGALPVRIGAGGAGITELEIPGVKAERTLVVPPPPKSTRPATVVMSAAPTVPSCFFVGDKPRCAGGVERESEDGQRIDRSVTLPAGGTYVPRVWVRPRPGDELNALLDREVAATAESNQPVPSVTASSTGFADPVARAGAIVDGDPATAWSPSISDAQPWLRLTWPEQRAVSGLRLALDEGVAAARPWRVNVVGDDGIRDGAIEPNGVVTFDRALLTDEITILFSATSPARSYDPYANRWDLLPVAVGEVVALPEPRRDAKADRDATSGRGADGQAPSVGESVRLDLDAQVTLPCGSGPTLEIGDIHLETEVIATLRDLHQLREVPARLCGSGDDPRLSLPAGSLRAISSASALATPTRLALIPDETRPAARSGEVRIDLWSATARRVHVEAGSASRILAVRENTNPGWEATIDGTALTRVVVDGWQQGWLLPAGVGGDIVLRFIPERQYRNGLLVGAGLLLAVLLLAVLPRHRRGTHAAPVAPKRRRRRQWIVPATVGGMALLAVGGVAAVVLGAMAVAAAVAWSSLPTPGAASTAEQRWLRRVAATAAWLLPGVLFGIAGWLSLTNADPRTAPGPHVVALAAATAMWVSVATPARRRGHLAPQR
jgi:arabinofuranan 3-O-arabinosyltransferase